jgi:hypothetical protein
VQGKGRADGSGVNFVKKKKYGDNASAAITKGKSRYDFNDKAKVIQKCYNCQSENHLARNCPKNGSAHEEKSLSDFSRKEEHNYQDKKKVHFQKIGNASVNAVARSELCCISFEIKGLPGVALVDSGSQVSMISKQFMDQ